MKKNYKQCLLYTGTNVKQVVRFLKLKTGQYWLSGNVLCFRDSTGVENRITSKSLLTRMSKKNVVQYEIR